MFVHSQEVSSICWTHIPIYHVYIISIVFQNTPSNRVNTTANLNALRQVMRDTTLTGGQVINAYLVYEGSYYGVSIQSKTRYHRWQIKFDICYKQ